MTRYVVAIIGFALTLVAIVSTLLGGASDLGALLFAAVGTPISIFLLMRAVLAPPSGTRLGVGSFLLGATVVPIVVLVLGALVAGVAVAVIDPLRGAVIDLSDELSIDTNFTDLLFTGWAFFLLVELAVVAPFLEETLKPLAALVTRPRTRSEALIFGAAAGAGFAVIENMIYASGSFWGTQWWTPISVLRMSGSALHLIGTALIALAVFELRQPKEQRLISLPSAYGLALGVHGVWNGSIAVVIVMFAGNERLGLPDDALAWGVGLLILLATFGVVLLAALLAGARAVREEEPLRRIASMGSLGRAEQIAAWTLVTTWLLVPIGIAVTVFPDLIAL
ncbi:MAG: PrsW family glutamic-type intramembrane protease [Actinomycetota bacterium]|nr:PrsW family glutamic-type intramembrane protease [Actinomycetota bacterium]